MNAWLKRCVFNLDLNRESLSEPRNVTRKAIPEFGSQIWQSSTSRFQGSRFFIIRHIHNHTSIISSEMQVELKKNTALHEESEEKKITPRLCSLGSTVWEQEKHLSNTKAHTRQSHRGSESGPASSHLIPQPLIRRWSDPLDQASGSKRTEANGWGGGGGNVCNVCRVGEERKSV